MKINQGNGMGERSGTTKPRIVIAPPSRPERERFDRDGNIIDPKSKQIIRKADEQE